MSRITGGKTAIPAPANHQFPECSPPPVSKLCRPLLVPEFRFHLANPSFLLFVVFLSPFEGSTYAYVRTP